MLCVEIPTFATMARMIRRYWWMFAVIFLFVGFLVGVKYVKTNQQPGALDGFAQCLSDKKATFYGAFWCPHCQSQKKTFGNSARLLPYTECSTPDSRGQLQICKDKGIQSYPVWEFADGSRLDGEQTLKALSEKTNCPLPEGV